MISSKVKVKDSLMSHIYKSNIPLPLNATTKGGIFLPLKIGVRTPDVDMNKKFNHTMSTLELHNKIYPRIPRKEFKSRNQVCGSKTENTNFLPKLDKVPIQPKLSLTKKLTGKFNSSRNLYAIKSHNEVGPSQIG